jgi:hypothetical protein
MAMVRVTNHEPNTVTGLTLSFFLEQYMKAPTSFAVVPQLAPGETAELPVTALLNEAMMDLTENLNANALIALDYRSLGSRKQGSFSVQMPIYHRNAMNWDDDRRAASFVSPRDPAARLFAKYVGSLMEERLRISASGAYEIPRNVQYALALFESLNVYGISYIIDPASSYVEMSRDASGLDNLNYPYQTLFYRGGDCDDLSILFCSLLEVLGIDTAFLTIPGHIYMAFDTGLEGTTGGTGQLISHEGKLWMPVEITIPASGFYRAWQEGAAEWRRAGSEGKIFPMHDSWELYPPVSVPNGGGRMPVMPDDETLIRAIDNSLNGYIRAR